MNLGEMIKAYESGAFNIEYTPGMDVAVMGTLQISKEQAYQICKNLGWTDFVLDPFKIIDKTAKFIKGIKNAITSDILLGNTDVTFHNRTASRYYEKNFDRIFLTNAMIPGFAYCIVYNMPGASAKYEIYKQMCGQSTLVQQCNTLRQVGDYINSLG